MTDRTRNGRTTAWGFLDRVLGDAIDAIAGGSPASREAAHVRETPLPGERILGEGAIWLVGEEEAGDVERGRTRFAIRNGCMTVGWSPDASVSLVGARPGSPGVALVVFGVENPETGEIGIHAIARSGLVLVDGEPDAGPIRLDEGRVIEIDGRCRLTARPCGRDPRGSWSLRTVRGRVLAEIELAGEFPFGDLARLRGWPASVEDVRRIASRDARPRLVRIVGIGGAGDSASADGITCFTVEGEGSFPLDMLRYCRCWPSGVEEARAIAPDRTGPRLVVLAGLGPLAPGRWTSFGWRLVGGLVGRQ